ncbi:molybdenum cofactor biosynthesis protein MoaE [Microbacterium sp. VKM Ac-2870]|uniref:molybdenum cofactor biosynthesis protein MoaE n=1 Tax=Microbacterium sp. VKM Ac-2870 TaxID=2783825 RepID=UPI00188A73AC|nr:molybdenum cofactor biosynthesis protein MoaE [Microbacterium sp. VKM Ac-2870]MBF4563039.1 molybdenum cofactor biosynthesis protein MoaE [Microbacterium sp. VKM Ac-2870]
MMSVRIARLSDQKLDVAAHLAAVEDAAAGAVASFIGTVRDHDPDAAGAVIALEYSAHPDAEATLHDIAVTAIGDRRAIVAVSHRIGRLEVGDVAVVIVVATPHRAEAFEICREIIEAIKRELPVWKRQLSADGTAAWKGLGG